MDQRKILELTDYCLELSRCRLRYCGIGPRLAGEEGRLWPRDALRPNDICRRLLYPDLRKSIDDHARVKKIESTICDLTESLRLCKLDQLFNRFCSVEHVFLKNPFSLKNRLNAHTEYSKIYKFIHNLLRSIRIADHGGSSLVYLFGSNYNFNLYKQHLKVLVNGNAKLKRVTIGRFVCFGPSSMDLDKVQWLDGLIPEAKYRVFIQLVFALTRFVAEALQRYFYIMISNPYIDKIFYFRYDLWQRMRDEAIGLLVSKRLLEPMVMAEESGRKETSKIRFLLKKDDIRLICTKQGNSRPSEEDFQLQAALVYILDKMPGNKNFNLVDFLNDLKRMRESSVHDSHFRPIYFVRADMEDCFHSINQEKLLSIIGNLLRASFTSGTIEFTKFVCARRRPRRGQCEVEKWSCSKELLMRSGTYLFAYALFNKQVSVEKFLTDYVRPQILRPVLRISKTSKEGFRLMDGIRQGSKNSPLFCSIYIQQALSDHMGHIVTDKEGRLFRYVDDLLYMTTNLSKAQEFVRIMLSGFEGFGLKSNASKLACNFACTDHTEVRQLEDDVIFFKRRISIRTLSCTHVFAYSSINIDKTFYVNPYYTERELQEYISRWARIELIHLDCELNGREIVVDNLFQHALVVAHRIATVLMVSFLLRNIQNQRPEFIERISEKVARRLFSSITLGKKHNRIVNDFDFREVRLITSAAFLTTWRTNKMRHRRVERDKLTALYERYKMSYLTTVLEEDRFRPRGIELEAKLRHLIFNFIKSSAWKEMRLPDKQ